MIRIIHAELQQRTSESFAQVSQVPETAKPAERAMADRKGHVVSFICHVFGCMLESEWLSTKYHWTRTVIVTVKISSCSV